MKELLDLRKKAKAKKPTFLKQGANTMVRLRNHWRQPKGQHSKIRKKLRRKKESRRKRQTKRKSSC
jgi:large subunit ribosomal protein L32e